ncbi:hypothetical protein AVEN_2956-1 [Araneus ventricosus]|uniref:Uncharacterized protein n=1 Tax=Araneus ventricosus TaxID=182803 RepID=A0A4Y2PPV5_ARAVE|nr:hypothetical protein AVEN_2956-1 [Araneus ventricosus]
MIITRKRFYFSTIISTNERCTYPMVLSAPRFQLHKILWVAISSAVGLRVERRHHLQSVCFQHVVLVDQTDENRLELILAGQRFSSDDDDEMMTTFNTKSYYG